MKRILDLAGMTAGGWLGWAIGAPLGTFSAFVVSMLGTGLGLYLAHRFTKGML